MVIVSIILNDLYFGCYRKGEYMVLVGNVFVGDVGSDVKYDDVVLVVDVVIIMEIIEFFLIGGILDVELDLIVVL